jgi:hypothetical protein
MLVVCNFEMGSQHLPKGVGEGIIAYKHISHTSNIELDLPYTSVADSSLMTWTILGNLGFLKLILKLSQLNQVKHGLHIISWFSCWVNGRCTHMQ